jgi:hypothetical protein
MNDVRVNRWIDFGERVAWTAIQAAGGAVITVLASDVTWEQGLVFVGITTLGAVAKVAIAQRLGKDDLGALPLPGQHVIETEPSATTVAKSK